MDNKKKELERLIKKVRSLIYNNYLIAVKLPSVKKAIKNGNTNFKFTKSDIEIIKKNLNISGEKMQLTVLNSIETAYTYGDTDAWDNIYKLYPEQKAAIKILQEISKSNHRSAAEYARTQYSRKRGGITLSQRVWNLNNRVIIEAEAIIQKTIIEGSDAPDLSREVRKFLREPNRIFRRVMNPRTGKLELSKAAKEYNPGRGVYRSSYKNALRLARTEINRAYRISELETYRGNKLIKAFEIKVSNNREGICPVCMELQGVYPKWFVWGGWHPQCRCRIIPIALTPKEFKEYLKDRNNYNNSINELPNNFILFLKENINDLMERKNLPYWLVDNQNRLEKYYR